MTASELLAICFNFDVNYIYSDLNTGASFGCECGCGGDSYTIESWDEMVKTAEDARVEFEKVCESLGIEWDYD